MLNFESDLEENRPTSQETGDNNHHLIGPTSMTRSESEDQLERLSQRIDTKISEGLTSSLTQFESRLETALECIRQTVTNSLSAGSQVVTDQESDVDREYKSIVPRAYPGYSKLQI